MTKIQAHMLSDIGLRRLRNEDAVDQYLPSPDDPTASLGQIFVLADGVGGLSDGNVASQEAVREVIRAYYDEQLSPPLSDVENDIQVRLRNAVESANQLVYKMGHHQHNPQGMATTLVIAAVRGNHFGVASVGDSPAFLVRSDNIRKLTIDHNFAELQWRAGSLSYEEAKSHPDRHKLMRAIGSKATIEVDIITDTLQADDYLLLCSDGLTKYVSETDIIAILQDQSLDVAVHALVDEANARGGFDNISVIAIQAMPDEDQPSQVASSGQAIMAGVTKHRWLKRVPRFRRLWLVLSGLMAFLWTLMRRGDATP